VARRASALVGLCAALVLLSSGTAGAIPIPAVPIPQDPREARSVPAFIGTPATAVPFPAPAVPPHPFMAANGRSNIHDDAYMTDTYTGAGPLGRNMRVRSSFFAADCASLTFDRKGRLVTVCVGLQGPFLTMLDRKTLATLALFPLPPRIPSGGSPFSDFTGGGYFYLDDHDRAVIPTTTREVWVVGESTTVLGPSFRLERRYNLSRTLAPTDAIFSVLPDWDGTLWFVTAQGVVGTIEPESGTIRATTLQGEAIANSFAVDETGGVYVVSDHALYRFDAGVDGEPIVTWREAYDRGTRVKPGQVSQGSGTTPSLMGSDLVAITDNADPRMNVLVYQRGASVTGPRLVCAEPVFAPGKGSTDNSLIVTGESIVVENNYGYTGPTATENGGSTEPGMARIDVGTSGCTTVWTSDERVPTVVSKLSLATGLVYTYTKDLDPGGTDAWYFTALDVRTGETIYKRLAGTGLGFNNNYAPLTVGPDGAAYVGVLGGLVQLRDGR
jgi:hypothetical protein